MGVLEQNSRKKMMLGHDSNTLVLLIVFNAIVFVILSFFKVTYLLNNSTVEAYKADILYYVTIPARFDVFLSRPWTLVSYMFSHGNEWELIANMLWLWCFGYALNQMTTGKSLIPLYLYGGLAGAVFFLLSVNLIPSFSKNINSYYPLTGGATSIMAIAVAATYISPQFKLFTKIKGGLPVWMVCSVFIVMSIGIATTTNPGNVMSLGFGGITGYLFAWQYLKGNDYGKWMSDLVNWIDDLFNPEKHRETNQEKNKLFYKADQPPFIKKPKLTQQRVDELLDKININGYNSLTPEEKEFLKNASKEEL